MSEREEEKNPAHATIHMGEDELIKYDVAAKTRRLSRNQYLLGLIRFARALAGEYDWKDATAIFKGGTPDRDWVKNEVKLLAKDVSPEEYQRRLLDSKNKTKQMIRLHELRIEIINDELEQVEHTLEK